MRFFLEILIIGLLFHSGYGKPASEDEEENFQSDTVQGNPTIVTPPQEFVAQLKGDLVLPCKVENNEQDDSVVWMHFNNNLFTDAFKLTERPNYSLDPVTHTLSIKNYTAELAGNYTCAIPLKKIFITHIVGQKERVVIEALNGKKYVENISELSISCRTRGFPTPTITWLRKSSENAMEHELNSHSPTFVIPSATFSDSGTYVCKADNGDSVDTKSVTIAVISGLAPESSKVYAGQSGGSSKLCCVFDTSRKINWLKEGKPISMSDRFAIESEKHKNCLVIKKAKEEDLGTYTCETDKNVIEHAEVELNGAPAKPISKQISYEEGSKTPTATWLVPSLFPISEYRVYTKKAEEMDWKELERKTLGDQDKKDEITYTFSNLANGRYSAKLEVINKYGSNESVDSGAIIVDHIDPNVIMSAKINSDSGAESQYRISSLCVLFVILMRLWSC